MRDWRFNHIDFSAYPWYGGDDLGVRLTETGFQARVWAPTAHKVEFLVFRKSLGGKSLHRYWMHAEEHGCWALEREGHFKGLYYTIRVNDGEWLNETPGVDARAVGINGRRGLFFDPAETNPEDWNDDRPVACENAVNAVLYEIHLRDFSVAANSGMTNKGKYLAFTEEGCRTAEGLSSGVDHLKELGITHVHLLPVFDFWTVGETKPLKKYNWGYDPLNYNTPEGSYASNPDTIARIKELKQLVAALHKAGIAVVMDVVYNHTGLIRRSWFNQTVPGYYYRQTRSGTFSNASGCGNEFASERAMARKYMIDSLLYWAREFHFDGFRFDLMGVHDLETMYAVRLALDKLRPGILMYGEGWTADRSPMDENMRAVKRNISQLERVACFNDDFRDALKGNNFDGTGQGFVSGRLYHEESIKFGIVAACYHPQIVYSYVGESAFAWARQPWQTVNYVSCHDNFTLYDKLVNSCPDATDAEIRKMQMLALALVITSQGIPFIHGGSEFCRSKNGEHNTYKSPDSINQLDWSRKKKYEDVFRYVCDLIRLRKDLPALRMESSDLIREHLKFSSDYRMGVVTYRIEDYPGEKRWRKMQFIFNARKEAFQFDLPNDAGWTVLAEENHIALEGIRKVKVQAVKVPAISMMILVQ
ncbi:pullulanase [Mangrovibacterium marinum]|uniref:Pullulanase n=1 Tax=Mangrovibacterium marinum TaxID=1639118 RepID=A0A2T5BYM5_9BACT|nr:type I pullulanase [Mangrovibacterium marinum]PTN07330.1 pullulanase [Mangrovibacterium marinum]